MHGLPIGLSLTPHPASVGQGGTIPALVQRAEHQTGRRVRRTGAGWGGPGESSALPAAHPCSWQLSSTCSVQGGTREAEQKIILRDPTAEQTPQPAPSPRAQGREPGSEPLQPEGACCVPPGLSPSLPSPSQAAALGADRNVRSIWEDIKHLRARKQSKPQRGTSPGCGSRGWRLCLSGETIHTHL